MVAVVAAAVDGGGDKTNVVLIFKSPSRPHFRGLVTFIKSPSAAAKKRRFTFLLNILQTKYNLSV